MVSLKILELNRLEIFKQSRLLSLFTIYAPSVGYPNPQSDVEAIHKTPTSLKWFEDSLESMHSPKHNKNLHSTHTYW